MDLEGSDGRERGEDDTNFERQSALFALAVADVLMVNIWCHDIGREQGSGKPLLKTIFQVRGGWCGASLPLAMFSVCAPHCSRMTGEGLGQAAAEDHLPGARGLVPCAFNCLRRALCTCTLLYMHKLLLITTIQVFRL